jgi:hypothetical protein
LLRAIGAGLFCVQLHDAAPRYITLRWGEKFFAPTTPEALHINNPVQAVRRSSGYTGIAHHPELRRSSTLYGVDGRAWHCPKPRAALRLHGATYLMRLRRIRITPLILKVFKDLKDVKVLKKTNN